MSIKQNRLSIFLFLTALTAISLMGAVMLKVATPTGLGLINDSTAYIAGARSILQGTGYSELWLATELEPITHYPPLLSSILALIGLSGLDPMRGARVLNILLYGSNIWLMGILGWEMSKRKIVGLFTALYFALSGVMLEVHAYAISEPLFIFFLIASIIFVGLHFEKQSNKYLVLAGFATGLALLTRYVGLALLASMVFVLLVLHTNWRKRFASVGIYLTSALPVFFAWIFRNRLLTGMATNRGVRWVPPTGENFNLGIHNFTDWLLHLTSTTISSPFLTLLVTLILSVLTIWLFYFGTRYFFKPANVSNLNTIGFFSVAFTLIYLSSLIVSLSFFDSTTRLLHRILSPIYVTFTIILVSAFIWLWNHRQVTLKIALGCLACIMFVLSGINYYQTVDRLMEDGLGYASSRFQNSMITNFLRNLPADVKIYTNSPPAVYSSTERRSYILFVDAKLNGETKSFYNRINREVKNGNAILAFYGIRKGDISSEAYDYLVDGLNLNIKHGTDMIYAHGP